MSKKKFMCSSICFMVLILTVVLILVSCKTKYVNTRLHDNELVISSEEYNKFLEETVNSVAKKHYCTVYNIDRTAYPYIVFNIVPNELTNPKELERVSTSISKLVYEHLVTKIYKYPNIFSTAYDIVSLEFHIKAYDNVEKCYQFHIYNLDSKKSFEEFYLEEYNSID